MKIVLIVCFAIGLAALPSQASAKALQLGCKVNGSSGVTIVNSSGTALPAGTKIKWEVGSPHASGKITLDAELASGSAVSLSDALIVPPAVGTACAAVALGM